MEDLLQIAAENPIIPVVIISNPENAPGVARALFEGGIHCMEITFRTGSAAQAIKKVTQSYPDMLVGAGTIVRAEQVDQAVDAGARFIVSPGLSEQVILRCKERGIPCLPGCVTAGEIMKALELGLKLVKFFPAETSGGINAVKALSAPFPDVKFIPTGGINMTNVKEYLQLPCVAACGGSWMVQETDINRGNFSEIRRKSRLAAEMLKEDEAMWEIITFGEPMVVYIAEESGSFQEVSHYSRGLAGAELNFAVGVTRLGHRASYFTKLGNDAYGDYIRSFIEKEGIDGSNLIFDSRYLSGSYVKTKVHDGDPEVFYFRKNSAASHIGPEDVRRLQFKGTGLFHLTGITPALSKECKAASIEAVKRARGENVTVMFDPNIREALWGSREEMRETLNTLAFESDIFLPGIKEGRLLTGLREPHEIADYYLKRGTGAVIIKLGAEGAYFKINTENSADSQKFTARTSGAVYAGVSEGIIPGYKPEKIVDTVGAGDAFAAGVACAVLEGLPLEEAVAAGNAMGAIIISSKGDNDNLPDKESLQSFMRNCH